MRNSPQVSRLLEDSLSLSLSLLRRGRATAVAVVDENYGRDGPLADVFGKRVRLKAKLFIIQ